MPSFRTDLLELHGFEPSLQYNISQFQNELLVVEVMDVGQWIRSEKNPRTRMISIPLAYCRTRRAEMRRMWDTAMNYLREGLSEGSLRLPELDGTLPLQPVKNQKTTAAQTIVYI